MDMGNRSPWWEKRRPAGGGQEGGEGLEGQKRDKERSMYEHATTKPVTLCAYL